MFAAFVITLACILFGCSLLTLAIAAWMGRCAEGDDRGAVHVPDISQPAGPDHRENAVAIPPVEAVR